jgi:hypothetical protein
MVKPSNTDFGKPFLTIQSCVWIVCLVATVHDANLWYVALPPEMKNQASDMWSSDAMLAPREFHMK